MRFRIAAKVIGFAAGGMWAFAFTAAGFQPGGLACRVLPDVRALAVTFSLAAFGCYLAHKLQDRAMLYLVDSLMASRRRAAEAQGAPLRAARAR